jgi:hypothetical protein
MEPSREQEQDNRLRMKLPPMEILFSPTLRTLEEGIQACQTNFFSLDQSAPFVYVGRDSRGSFRQR